MFVKLKAYEVCPCYNSGLVVQQWFI